MKILFTREELDEIIMEHVRTNLDVKGVQVIKHKIGNLEVLDTSYVEIEIIKGTNHGKIPSKQIPSGIFNREHSGSGPSQA